MGDWLTFREGKSLQKILKMDATKILQVEGVSAKQFFDVFRCLESQIDELKKHLPKRQEETVYLTRQEAAELLKVSLVTLTDWTNKGHLKSYRIGQKVYYKASEIDTAMVEIKKGGRKHE